MEINIRKIKQIRSHLGWTQQQLADACALSLDTIGRIEKQGNASQSSVANLCTVLKISPADISAIPDAREDAMSLVRITNPVILMVPSILLGIVAGITICQWIFAS